MPEDSEEQADMLEDGAPEQIGHCDVTGREIVEGDETLELHDGRLILADADIDVRDDVEGVDGFVPQRECVQCPVTGEWRTENDWNESAVEPIDCAGELVHREHCEEMNVWGMGLVWAYDPDTLCYCEECEINMQDGDGRYDGAERLLCPDCHDLTCNATPRCYSSSPLDQGGAIAHGREMSGPAFRASRLPLMGVELEVEATYCDREYACQIVEEWRDSKAHSQWAIAKHDSSLDELDGFEICSVPALMSDHRRNWPSLVRILADEGCRSYMDTDNRCGIHVHINRGAFRGDLHVARFCHLISDPAQADLSRCIAQRDSKQWAAFRDKKAGHKSVRYDLPTPLAFDPETGKHELMPREKWPEWAQHIGETQDGALLCNPPRNREGYAYIDHWHAPMNVESICGYAYPGGHYDAANPSTGKGTVEVRIYKGTLHPQGVLRAIEHVHSAWSYTLDCGIAGANGAGYMQWLSRRSWDYRLLAAYLYRKYTPFRAIVRQAGFTRGQLDALRGVKHDKPQRAVTEKEATSCA